MGDDDAWLAGNPFGHEIGQQRRDKGGFACAWRSLNNYGSPKFSAAAGAGGQGGGKVRERISKDQARTDGVQSESHQTIVHAERYWKGHAPLRGMAFPMMLASKVLCP